MVPLQAAIGGDLSEVDTASRTGSPPIQASRSGDHRAVKDIQPLGRKELAYAGHLHRVHQ